MIFYLVGASVRRIFILHAGTAACMHLIYKVYYIIGPINIHYKKYKARYEPHYERVLIIPFYGETLVTLFVMGS